MVIGNVVTVLAPEESKLSSCSPALGALLEVSGKAGAVFSYAVRASLPAEEK